MPLTTDSKYQNKYSRNKGYQKLLFIQGRTLQSSELNELQENVLQTQKDITNYLIKNGTILNGGKITELRSSSITLDNATIYVDGNAVLVSGNSLPINGTGIEVVGIITSSVIINSTVDQDLLETNINSQAYGRNGADRLKITGIWALSTNSLINTEEIEQAFYSVLVLENGKIASISNFSNEAEKVVDKMLGRYDNDLFGNYVIKGLSIKYRSKNTEGKFEYQLESGAARINGNQINNPYTTIIMSEPVEEVTSGISYTTFTGVGNYPLNLTPVKQVTGIFCTKQITDENVVKGISSGTDILANENIFVDSIVVSQGVTTYESGVDFTLLGNVIDWSLTGVEPNPGTTYQVSYKYTTITTATIQNYNTAVITDQDIVLDTVLFINYEYYLNRIDRVIVTQNGFQVLKGIPAKKPSSPGKSQEVLSLAIIKIGFHDPGIWDNEPEVIEESVTVVSLKELNSMKKDLADIKLNIAQLSLLENAKSQDPTTVKKNLIVNPLYDTDLFDLGRTNTLFLDTGNNSLSISPNIDTGSFISNNRFEQDYTSEVSVSQPYITNTKKINPYALRNLVPDPLFFTDVNNAEINITVTSNTLTVKGLTEAVSININTEEGLYSINGAAFTNEAGTIQNNNTLALRTTSSNTFDKKKFVNIQIGNGQFTWDITTRKPKLIPTNLTNIFIDSNNLERLTTVSSNIVEIIGLEPNYLITVSATNGTIDAGTSELSGTFSSSKDVTTSPSGTIKLQAKGTSSDNFGITVNVFVKVVESQDIFSITTKIADLTPDDFVFQKRINTQLNTTIQSETVTVTGLEPLYPFNITATNGTIDAGTASLSGTFSSSKTVTTSSSGTIKLAARVDTLGEYLSPYTVTVELEGFKTVFTAITIPLDDTPNNFDFNQVTSAGKNTIIVSDTVTVNGLTPNIEILVSALGGTIDSGTYALSGNFVTSKTVIVSPSGTLVVAARVISSNDFNTATYCTVKVGTGSDTFVVTTRRPFWNPTFPKTEIISNKERDTFYNSSLVNISGLEPGNLYKLSTNISNFSIDAGTSSLSGTFETEKFVNADNNGRFVFMARGKSGANLGNSIVENIHIRDDVFKFITFFNFIINTRILNNTPNEFSFNDIKNANVNIEVTSNVVNVSGLEPDCVIQCSIDPYVRDGSSPVLFDATIRAHTNNINSATWKLTENVLTSSTGTLVLQAKVLTSSNSLNLINLKVTVGNYSTYFKITLLVPSATTSSTSLASTVHWTSLVPTWGIPGSFLKTNWDKILIKVENFVPSSTVVVVTEWGLRSQSVSTSNSGFAEFNLMLLQSWTLNWGEHQWHLLDVSTGRKVYFNFCIAPLMFGVSQNVNFASYLIQTQNRFKVDTWMDPIAQTFVLQQEQEINSVDIYFTEKPTNIVFARIVTTKVGIPDKDAQLGIGKLNSSAMIIGWNTINFDIPIKLEANKEYALILLTEDFIGSVGTCVIGEKDNIHNKFINEQPHVGVFLLFANQSTWTPAQNEDLSFTLNKCIYSTTPKTVNIGTISVTNITDWFLSAISIIPEKTNIRVYLKTSSNIEYDLELNNITITPKLSGDIEIKAQLFSTTQNFGPKILEGLSLNYGTPTLPGIYTQRTFSTTASIGNPVSLKVIIDEYRPLDIPNNKVAVYYYDGSTYIEMTRGTSTSIGTRKWTTEFNKSNIEVEQTHIKIELDTTELDKRPIISKIRTLII